MALPKTNDLITLDFLAEGLPFLTVEAKAGINTQTLDVLSRGLSMIANSANSSFLASQLLLLGLG